MVSIWVTEYVLNSESDNYKCYLKREAKREAEGGKCPGYWSYCKKCTYKKNHDKGVKENDCE